MVKVKILILIIVLFAGFSAYLVFQNYHLNHQQVPKNASEIALGNLCDTRAPLTSPDLYKNTYGLECVTLGQSDAWRGIWVYPQQTQAQMMASDPLSESILAGWKTYTSPDKSFSFKYPKEWTIVPSGEDQSSGVQVLMGAPQTIPPAINILSDKVPDVVKSLDEYKKSLQDSSQDLGAAKLLEATVTVQGVQATRYEIIPNSSLAPGSIALVIGGTGQVVSAQAEQFDQAQLDYPMELLFTTIKVK